MAATAVGTRSSRRAGIAWFTLMVGAWLAFVALLLFSEAALGEIQDAARNLPFVVEGIVWFATFPLMLGVTVWESSWEAWVRLLLVVCSAVAWSAAFYPRSAKERS